MERPPPRAVELQEAERWLILPPSRLSSITELLLSAWRKTPYKEDIRPPKHPVARPTDFPLPFLSQLVVCARHGVPGAEQPCRGSRGGGEYGGVFEEQQAGLRIWGTESGGTGQRTLVGEFFMLCPVLIYLHPAVFQEST